jgi:hypothetical protein
LKHHQSDIPPHDFPPEASNVKPLLSVVTPPSSASGSYPRVWVSDAVLELGARPLLKGLIDPGAFVVIYGPSGSGKSFFTADIAQHIATGTHWRDKRVSQGLVVYVASEAGSSIIKRFVGWRDTRLSDSAGRIPLAILTRGPNLLNMVELEKLAEQLEDLQEEAGLPLAMTIFDTLSRSIPGGDENNAQDMTMAVNAADYLRERFKCATAYVHHSGKDPSKGARGHSALFAAADLVIGIQDRVATVEKVRDGVSGERFPFSLEPIEVGKDADGDPVLTCLLNATDVSAPRKDYQPTAKNQKIVIGPLREMARAKGDRSPGTSITPRGALTLSMSELIDAVIPKFGDLPGFRAREKIMDALMGLQANGVIGVYGDLIWLT